MILVSEFMGKYLMPACRHCGYPLDNKRKQIRSAYMEDLYFVG